MRFKAFFEKHRRIISNLAIGFLFLLCINFFLIDLTYKGNINIGFLVSETSWLGSILTVVGFKRSAALKLINSSFGLVLTMVTIVLNLGTNLFNRSEHKVFGISCRDLQADDPFMMKLFQKAGFFIRLSSLLPFC